ncbi:MAG: glycosyltransferase family 39 protein [Sideroxydans sp.]|nr:glycosyltransferase family 39 protein [Sideroxydans sp.]
MNATFAAKKWWWLVLALAVIWFANLQYRALIKPDEGRYAEIAREMATSGDWVTPRLNNLKYFEKPPLQYWATATAYKVFGEYQWTARLWAGLTGFLSILLVGWTAYRLWGREVALYAAAILASNVLFVGLGHLNTLDMGLTFFMTLTLCGILLAQHDAATPLERRRWMLIAWAAMAAAMLSKGLIGIVLPGAVWIAYSVIARNGVMWMRMNLLKGLLLFAALVLPWFVLVARANPEFLHFFFIYEHFERFLEMKHFRYEPWWWFLPVLLIGIVPWLLLMVDALIVSWKDSAQFKSQRFLLIWAVLIFVFFSRSNSKLASYILPIFPALAMLMALHLSRITPRRIMLLCAPILLAALAILFYVPHITDWALGDYERVPYTQYGYWLTASAAAWLMATLVGGYCLHKNNKPAGVLAIALGGLLLVQGVVTGHESLAATTSTRELAAQIAPYNKLDIPFYSVAVYDQTLPFYLKRTFTLVAYQDEMAFGIQQEPHKWIATLVDFSRVWAQQPQALAVMPPAIYAQLQTQQLAMQVVARDVQYVVVKKP